MKTPVCLGLGSGDAVRHFPPEGVVVELRCSRACDMVLSLDLSVFFVSSEVACVLCCTVILGSAV